MIWIQHQTSPCVSFLIESINIEQVNKCPSKKNMEIEWRKGFIENVIGNFFYIHSCVNLEFN